MVSSSLLQQKKKLFFVDAMRSWAIINVVLLHSASPSMLKFDSLNPEFWWSANFFFTFAHHAVPLFIMISGLLLLDPSKTESLMTFLKKRFFRVVVPFLTWGIIYFIWRIYFHGETIHVWKAIGEIIAGPIYFHFWFIYMIFGVYLSVPILKIYIRKAESRDLIYFLALWFIAIGIVADFGQSS